jgi:hypothetical protein
MVIPTELRQIISYLRDLLGEAAPVVDQQHSVETQQHQKNAVVETQQHQKQNAVDIDTPTVGITLTFLIGIVSQGRVRLVHTNSVLRPENEQWRPFRAAAGHRLRS